MQSMARHSLPSAVLERFHGSGHKMQGASRPRTRRSTRLAGLSFWVVKKTNRKIPTRTNRSLLAMKKSKHVKHWGIADNSVFCLIYVSYFFIDLFAVRRQLYESLERRGFEAVCLFYASDEDVFDFMHACPQLAKITRLSLRCSSLSDRALEALVGACPKLTWLARWYNAHNIVDHRRLYCQGDQVGFA